MVEDAEEILSKLFIDPSRIGIGVAPPRADSDRTNNNRSFLFPIDCIEQPVRCAFIKPFWCEGKLLKYYYSWPYSQIILNKQFAPHVFNFSHRVSGIDGHRGCVGG